MKFEKGKSGNPKGRPKDSRTAELRSMLEAHAAELVERAVQLARQGDTTALRLCLERILPPLKAREGSVTVSGLGGAGSLAGQGRKILAAAATGEISPAEASTLMQALSAQARVFETDELERRISELEIQE